MSGGSFPSAGDLFDYLADPGLSFGLLQPSDSSTSVQTERDRSRDHAPAPPQYDDPIPYHPKPSIDLPPYEPLPDTFQARAEKSTPKSNLSLAASASATASASDEKRRLDLEAVTTAVDQAYAATPQFDDQRSELRPSGSRSASAGVGSGMGQLIREGTALGRKMSLKDEKELNKLFDQIERAHGHSESVRISLCSGTSRLTDKILLQNCLINLPSWILSGQLNVIQRRQAYAPSTESKPFVD
jgi:hypothetical protein